MWVNVCEWCLDWYDEFVDYNKYKYGEYELIEKKNPCGPKTGNKKIIKGGCNNQSGWPRCSWKHKEAPGIRDDLTGFRIVLMAED
jgi:formylglycine-generating enzyme required for sulfatase activity